MRTLWHAIKRVLFWSYERGTWQYDLAVVGIVLFLAWKIIGMYTNTIIPMYKSALGE